MLVTALAPAAFSQTYPAKPIRLIVPFVPGGGTDLIARILSQRLTEPLGQTVIVDNRPGAGGVIGAELVAKSPPDGYTLLMGTPGPLTINPALLAKMPYTLEDFAPIALTTISPYVTYAVRVVGMLSRSGSIERQPYPQVNRNPGYAVAASGPIPGRSCLTCSSAWYDERTSGPAATCSKPSP